LGLALAALVWSMLVPVAQAQTPVVIVSSADFNQSRPVAPNSLVSAFPGTPNFVTQNPGGVNYQGQLPLPTTLNGVTVRVNGELAGLLFVGPTQINFLVPASTADGQATVQVTNNDGSIRTGTVNVVRAAPSIFTANFLGTGAPAANTTKDGINFLPVGNANGTPIPLDAGTTAQPNFLVLYLTGIRNAPAANPGDANGVAEAVEVLFGTDRGQLDENIGVPAQVTYAGPSSFAGLDQINAVIPPQLAGVGDLFVKVRVKQTTPVPARDEANIVLINIGGQLPLITVAPIASGQTIAGALTADDQLQLADGNLFFIDAYFFETTAPNQTISVDLRSQNFDAFILLYMIENNSLRLVAADDFGGGYGAGQNEINNDAFLFTRLADPGRYVIIVTTSDFEPLGRGAYSLTLKADQIQTLNYGASLMGAITTSDIKTSSDAYLDVYGFVGQAGDRVRIDVTGTGANPINPLIVLQNNFGDILDDSDTEGMVTPPNARVEFQLPSSGYYVFLVTPYTKNQTGTYNLSLNRIAGGPPAAAAAARPYEPAPHSRLLLLDQRGWQNPDGTRINRFGPGHYLPRRFVRRAQ
jgi:uncharacterized protein (TIGR03437 family)